MARASEQNPTPEEAPAPHNEAAATGVNWSEQVALLRGLAAIVRDEELSELLLEQAGVRLSLRSRRPSIVPPEPALPTVALPIGASLNALGVDVAPAPAQSEEDAPEATEEEIAGTPIVSPMVGTFWHARTPADAPFVEVGDHVEIGQVIGLIEAMKTFNEIQSEVEGEVAAIPARNGDLVEAGQPLVVVG